MEKAEERETLARMVDEAVDDPDPLGAGLRYWRLVTDDALIYGPLFFELSSHAMLGLPLPLLERLLGFEPHHRDRLTVRGRVGLVGDEAGHR